MGHIQTKITLFIFVEKIKNLCSNSSLGYLLSNRCRLHLVIPNRSNTRTSNRHKTIHSNSIFVRIKCSAILMHLTKKSFLLPTFLFSHSLPGGHRWNLNFGWQDGPYSNENSHLDLCQKNSKFLFKFKFGISTF